MKVWHQTGMWLLLMTGSEAGHALQQSTGIDEQAGLPYWEIRDKGMSLRLVQRLPVQTRAFFLARGFGKQQLDRLAQACIFQTVFKNISHQSQPAMLEYDLRDWQVIHGGQSIKLKLREDWNAEWEKAGVGKSQRIAFEWSMYPTRQQYKPGDYNWGMSDFNLKPGMRFDLRLRWRQFDKLQQATIRDMQCAPDINPPPDESF